MDWKVVTIINIAWCVTAHPPATSEQKFIQYYRDNDKIITEQSSENYENHEKYVEAYPLYEFSYKISDPHTHDYKGQEETRHGNKVNGDYWLVEPDGRKRVVKYHANDKIGFKVLVDYLKMEHPHPILLKDQESYEISKEKKDEKDQKPWYATKHQSLNGVENSQANIEPKSQETEEQNKKSGNEETDEKKSDGEVTNKVSNMKVKKNMRHRPHTRKNEKYPGGGNLQRGKSRESIIVQKQTEDSKEWGKRKHTYQEKQEKETDDRNSNEQNKENDAPESKSYQDQTKKINQYHTAVEVKPVQKQYEVNEEIIENSTEEKNDQSGEAKSEETSTGKDVISNSNTKSNENESNGKSGENKENKEEIFGYKTFIYHKRHE